MMSLDSSIIYSLHSIDSDAFNEPKQYHIIIPNLYGLTNIPLCCEICSDCLVYGVVDWGVRVHQIGQVANYK